MPKINGETVRSVPIPLPPLLEQALLLQRVDAANAMRVRADASFKDAIALLASLEQSILTMAFRGELLIREGGNGE